VRRFIVAPTGVLLLMADYFFTVVFENQGVQAIEYFQLRLGNGRFFIVLFILKKTMGLRVTKEEEIDGLDIHEHGTNVYND
jgi:Amt family ammonium transporter